MKKVTFAAPVTRPDRGTKGFKFNLKTRRKGRKRSSGINPSLGIIPHFGENTSLDLIIFVIKYNFVNSIYSVSLFFCEDKIFI